MKRKIIITLTYKNNNSIRSVLRKPWSSHLSPLRTFERCSHPSPVWLLPLGLLSILQSSALCLTHCATCSPHSDSQKQGWKSGSGEGKPEGLCPWQEAYPQKFPPKESP